MNRPETRPERIRDALDRASLAVGVALCAAFAALAACGLGGTFAAGVAIRGATAALAVRVALGAGR